MANDERGDEDRTVYEIGYLVLPSIPEDKVSGITDEIKKIISKEGGVEIDGEALFKHPLAYTMSKTVGASRYVVDEAYIGWIKFELEPSKTVSIKASIEKIDEVLRFLVIKAPRKTDFTFAKARIEEESGDEGQTESEEVTEEKTTEQKEEAKEVVE